jgi:mannosylglycerate hydrolase
MTTPTYHVVSHSHWDREWYRTFEQFRFMLVNLVDDLLTLLETDPSYRCFTLDGQTVILEDYLQVRPEHEERLRALIRDGRLVIGPWYILPDEFLVSAEATVRNLMTGIAVARRFGNEMRIGYIPDSFGHIAMVPAILRGFGMDTALIYRGFGGEPGQETSEYWWTSPDGSKVLMIHLFSNGYSAGNFHNDSEQEAVARCAQILKEIDQRATTSQRLIMNGGDHHWPDPGLPARLDLFKKHFPGDFVHSNLPRYVEALRPEVADLKEVSGEHRFGYRYAFAVNGGVYSSRMYIKQANWKVQMLLQRYAEPLNLLATVRGMRSQLPHLRHAWKMLLQNHPHDSICGCSIDAVHRDMMTRFSAVGDVGNAIVQDALNHLIPYDERASKDDRLLFFFNPSSSSRSDIAEGHVEFFRQDIVVGLNPDVQRVPKLPPVKGFHLRDQEGKSVPYQVIRRGEGYGLTSGKYDYPKQTYGDQFDVLVDARDIPPVGFRGYTIEKANRQPRFATRLRCGRFFLENDHLRVDVDRRGGIRVRDKRHEWTLQGQHVLEDGGDAGDEYNYSYPRRDKIVLSTRSVKAVTLIEEGPLRGTIQIRYSMRVPAELTEDRQRRSTRRTALEVVTRISLTASGKMVEFDTSVENTARDHRLRVRFTTGIKTRTAIADSQFTIVERTVQKHDVRQFTIEHPAKVAPMQRFVALKDVRRAFVLMAYGLPEYELLDDGRGTLALTLFRSVGVLSADDLITRPGGKAGWHFETPDAQCPGANRFRYAVALMSGREFEDGKAVNEVCEVFHQPLLAVARKNPTDLALDGSLFATSGTLTLSAVKEAEDGHGAIIRLYNPSSRSVEDTVRFVPDVAHAWLAGMDEQTIAPLTIVGGHAVPLTAAPGAVLTVRAIVQQR